MGYDGGFSIFYLLLFTKSQKVMFRFCTILVIRHGLSYEQNIRPQDYCNYFLAYKPLYIPYNVSLMLRCDDIECWSLRLVCKYTTKNWKVDPTVTVYFTLFIFYLSIESLTCCFFFCNHFKLGGVFFLYPGFALERLLTWHMYFSYHQINLAIIFLLKSCPVYLQNKGVNRHNDSLVFVSCTL